MPVPAVWKCLLVFVSTASFAKELPSSSHFQKVVLATNLLEPIQLSISQSGDVYLAERHGLIKSWKAATGETITVGQLNVFTGPEDGLLGLALDPGFETNHWIFAFHSNRLLFRKREQRVLMDLDEAQ